MTIWSTDDKSIVDAYQADCETEATFVAFVVAEAAKLGDGVRPMRSAGIFGAPRTVGLHSPNPDSPPDGWVYRKGLGYLVPRRGKPGDAARTWLDSHQPPEVNARQRLERSGMAAYWSSPSSYGYRTGRPEIMLWDSVVWVRYRGTPGNDILVLSESELATPKPPWRERLYSEWHAAKEASAASRAAGASE